MKNVLIGILIAIMMAATLNAAVIPGVTATASASEGTGPVDALVNGNGFTPTDSTGWNGTHSIVRGDPFYAHWFTKTINYTNMYVEFDLGEGISTLKKIKVWNLNWLESTGSLDYMRSGVKDMDIIVTDRNGVSTNLGQYTLTIAPGDATYDFGQEIDIPDQTDTRYVKFQIKNIQSVLGDRPGLSEVRFDGDYVNAGADQTVTMSSGSGVINLDGDTSATNVTWTSSPASGVSFGNPDAVDTTATFTVPGTYILTLTDDISGAYDTLKVTVFMEPLAPGLVGHWPLDGNANDATANNNDGTVVGAPQYVDGKVGQGIKFNGGYDGVTIPNEWFFEGTNPTMTVSFWAKVPYGARPEGVVVGKKDYTINTGGAGYDPENKGQGWGMDTYETRREGHIIWIAYTEAGGRLEAPVPSAAPYFDTPNDGKWHHYAAVIEQNLANSNYHVDLYLDGVLLGTTGGITTTNLLNDTPLAFGHTASFPGLKNWAGYLDNVRIYNEARTLSQIQAEIAADGGTCGDILGDISGDCDVDVADFILLAQDWLQ